MESTLCWMGKQVRSWLLLCLLALVPYWAQASECDPKTPIKIADLSWESAQFSTALYERILQQAYGCSTERIPGSSAALETALTQNHLQLIPEVWSGRTEIIEQALSDKTVQLVGNTLQGGAEQGWYVPTYLIEGEAAQAPALRSVQDLKKYSDLFADPDRPEVGRFYNCPTGWVCETFNTQLFNYYGLEKNYDNFRPGTGAALDAAISSAYDRRQPILFYYWQPAGLMAKYDFTRLQAGPFKPACWEQLLNKQGKACASDFIVATLSLAVSTPFAQAYPQLMAFFDKVELAPEQMNQIILAMNEHGKDTGQLVDEFLRNNPEQWQSWLSPQARQNLQAAMEQGQDGKAHSFFPNWSFSDWTNQQLMHVVQRYGDNLRQLSAAMLNGIILPLERGLMALPVWLILLLFGVLAWHASRQWYSAVLTVGGLYLIGAFGLWDKLIQTFALVIVASVIAVILGIPLGIAAAWSRLTRQVLTPILDVMQTMPGFVYLIPVLMLFGLGKVPAVMATVVYAMPPLIRLTSLGIRQVDHNVMEAAQAYGVTRWQMLRKVTLPLARPSIMAGINQSMMMALSMMVVASMIGAQGLGEDVLAGIQTLDIGRGLQAGLAIVILAIVMDRISQHYGRSKRVGARRSQ